MLKFLGVFWLFIFYCMIQGHSQTLSPDAEKQIMSSFSILDHADSSEESVIQAMQTILAIGKPALPLVEKQWQHTQQPRYLYLIQKLNSLDQATIPSLAANPISSTTSDQQAKLRYFRQRLQDVRQLLDAGNPQAAEKLIQAILVLEPKLPFHAEIIALSKQCKEAMIQQQVISGVMESPIQFYEPGQNLQLRLGFYNRQNTPIALIAGNQNGIVIDIVEQEFSYNGEYRERSFNHTYDLNGTIILPAGIQWLPMITVPVSQSLPNSYHHWSIAARVPRIRVEVQQNSLYPSVLFPKIELHSLPSRWHFVIRNPSQAAIQALSKQDGASLFFSSFFWNEQHKKQVIPQLIAQWPGRTSQMQRIIPTILKLTTGQNFESETEWRNWWASKYRED